MKSLFFLFPRLSWLLLETSSQKWTQKWWEKTICVTISLTFFLPLCCVVFTYVQRALILYGAFDLLQEANAPQSSSHGVKISEPQKKTSFFRCSLLWGSERQRPGVNRLSSLAALPRPSLFCCPTTWPVLPVCKKTTIVCKRRTFSPLFLF